MCLPWLAWILPDAPMMKCPGATNTIPEGCTCIGVTSGGAREILVGTREGRPVHERDPCGEEMTVRTRDLTAGVIDVIYIAGSGHCGSTLLDRLLSATGGFFSGGEIARVWDRGFLKTGQRCGCGVEFHSCDFWTSVMRRAFGAVDRTRAEQLADAYQSLVQIRDIPTLVLRRTSGRLGSTLHEYLGTLRVLYDAIVEISDNPVIVDSSKRPAYGILLTMVPGVRVQVIHLVRDSRAAAYSEMRKSQRRTGSHSYLSLRELVVNSQKWNAAHLAARILARHADSCQTLRYEDIASTPAPVVTQALTSIGFPQDPDEDPGDTFDLGVAHQFAGNARVRSIHGEVKVRLDEEWRRELPIRHRKAVTALTWPGLRRYGYL